jgi:DNA-binding MurR/RpiR family transcriptional regulator
VTGDSRAQFSISATIADRLDTMTASERRAAQTLVANYPVVGLKTVADFAQQAGVSSPTILRFVARLDFANYAEFQAALRDELTAQLQSPLSRSSSAHQSAASAFADAAAANIQDTFRHLPQKQIGLIAELLADPRARIYLAGGRFTDPLAHYLAAHMMLLRSNVIHLAGQENTWRDRLVDMGKRDVLIVFDIRRYQETVIALAEKAKKRGVSVVLFTDQWLSPAARFASHVVAGRTGVPSPWDSSAALLVAIEALIAALTHSLDAEGARRMAEIEALR